MDTDLTSISTHGWFVEENIESELKAVSIFGWYYDTAAIIGSGLPDIIYLTLKLNKQLNMGFER